MRATPSPMQGRARAGGFTALRLHSFTASRRGAGAAGRRVAQSRATRGGRQSEATRDADAEPHSRRCRHSRVATCPHSGEGGETPQEARGLPQLRVSGRATSRRAAHCPQVAMQPPGDSRRCRRAGDAPRGRRLCSPPVTRRSCRAIATCFGTRGGGGREGTLDSTNRGPDWWLDREGRCVAMKRAGALRRRDWYSHTTGARDAATQALFSYLTTISCLRLDFVDRLVGKRYMGGSYDRGMPPPCLHGRWRWEQSEALSSEIRGPPRGGARAPRRRFHQRRHAATCDGAPVRDDARGEEGRGGTLDSLAPARPTRVGRGGAPRIAWRRVGTLAAPCDSRPRRATAHPRLVPCVSQPTP